MGHLRWAIFPLALAGLACSSVALFAETPQPASTAEPAATSTPLPPMPVQPGAANPDEPVFVTGTIPFTSPFFLSSSAEPFVLLEDEAGFVARDLEFEFPLVSQAIGPVEIVDDSTATYSLALPAIPQGTAVDVDHDGESDTGIQVFAVAYWANTWGGPFLERRDGRGWSTAYTSAITDPDNDYEIIGGTLIIWAPDDQQQFPTGFGEDGKLFTEDDPVAPVLPGYSLVNLDQEPFRIYKEPRPELTLLEGEIAVNDFSDMSYTDAFDALFAKVSREYPFTEDKSVDWDALYEEFAPRVAEARSDVQFYRALRDFAFSIPDGHVGGLFNRDAFLEEQAGSFGMILAELTDGRVLVTDVLPGTPADRAGIEVGAEILEWDGQAIAKAISEVNPNLFSSHSTETARRQDQIVFLTRVPIGTRIAITYRNPGQTQPDDVTLTAVQEVDSLVQVLFPPAEALNLPVEADVLEETGIGYIRVSSFSDDDNLTARLWERYINQLIDNDVPGLIIDLRRNGGGNGSLANAFAGFFFDEEVILSQRSYYNERTQQFELEGIPSVIEPAPVLYEGPIAVLIGPNCVSACEGFAYALSRGQRAIMVGNFPTAGAFGEVGRGQYQLPGDLRLQFPTGRPETPDGRLLIEGTGVVPDIVVPVTEDQVLGRDDPVLAAAVEALLERIGD